MGAILCILRASGSEEANETLAMAKDLCG